MQPMPNQYYFQNNPAYQPYQQPQFQQQPNPYADGRLVNLQQYHQSLQQPMSNQATTPMGKVVDSIDAVKATDIPMDGNNYYFPKADGTEIYAKRWLANGTTQISTFKPVSGDDPSNLSTVQEKSNLGITEDFTQAINERFDGLEKQISDLGKSLGKTSTKVTSKKESEG